jgi:predicted nicotinamide N-methyase
MTPEEGEAFIKANATLTPPSLIPEFQLWSADESTVLWEATETVLNTINLPPPFWAFAWPGGQALARYILDVPKIVTGKRVLDFGAGGGLCSLAARKSRANNVLAADLDPFAAIAQSLNCKANGLTLDSFTGDASLIPIANFDVILAGDIFYDKSESKAAIEFLVKAANAGLDVYVGDPGRTYLPSWLDIPLASYSVPTSQDLECDSITPGKVWKIEPRHSNQ